MSLHCPEGVFGVIYVQTDRVSLKESRDTMAHQRMQTAGKGGARGVSMAEHGCKFSKFLTSQWLRNRSNIHERDAGQHNQGGMSMGTFHELRQYTSNSNSIGRELV